MSNDAKQEEAQVSDDDWAAAMGEQAAAEGSASAEDDWAAAMNEQAAVEKATAAAAQPAVSTFENFSGGSASPNTHQGFELILDIPVQLTVELGRTKISIRSLLQLAHGSVVELDGLAGPEDDRAWANLHDLDRGRAPAHGHRHLGAHARGVGADDVGGSFGERGGHPGSVDGRHPLFGGNPGHFGAHVLVGRVRVEALGLECDGVPDRDDRVVGGDADPKELPLRGFFVLSAGSISSAGWGQGPQGQGEGPPRRPHLHLVTIR